MTIEAEAAKQAVLSVYPDALTKYSPSGHFYIQSRVIILSDVFADVENAWINAASRLHPRPEIVALIVEQNVGKIQSHLAHRDGVKQSGISGVRKNGLGDRWFQDGAARHGSKSNRRKASSAMIAKIPFPLAQHIARYYKPQDMR